jgi:hypothetical protein
MGEHPLAFLCNAHIFGMSSIFSFFFSVSGKKE